MSAFPGFSYGELLNFDYRELVYWFKQSLIKKQEGRIEDAQIARLANVDNKAYRQFVSTQMERLRMIKGGRAAVDENWEDLKREGRRHRRKKRKKKDGV